MRFKIPRLKFGLDKFSGLYLGALFIVVFGIWKPALFLSSATFQTIATGQAVNAIVALAVLIPLAAGAFDLSVGATANLTAVVAVVMMNNHHWNAPTAILLALAVGVLIGVINGLIVVKLKVNSFIATLGTTSIIGAVQTIISPSEPSPPTNQFYVNFVTRDFLGTQAIVFYLLILAIVVWWFLEHTAFGRRLYAVGGNAEAARLSGVRVNRLTFISLTFSGLLAGLAGVFYGSQVGPSLSFGAALLLPAFAAAFLGSTQLKPGRVNVWGTVIAIYVLAIGIQGMEFVTSEQWVNGMFSGVALVGAVAFAIWRQDRAGSSRRSDSTTLYADPQSSEEDSVAGESGAMLVRSAGDGDGDRHTG